MIRMWRVMAGRSCWVQGSCRVSGVQLDPHDEADQARVGKSFLIQLKGIPP